MTRNDAMSQQTTQASTASRTRAAIDVAPLIEAHKALVEAATKLYERALEAAKRL
jgi:hypothetical protein